MPLDSIGGGERYHPSGNAAMTVSDALQVMQQKAAPE